MKRMLLLAAVTALAACGGRNNPDQTSSEGAVLPNAGGQDTTAVSTDTTSMNRDTSSYGRDTTTVNANPSVSAQDTSMAAPGEITNDSLRILCGRFAQGDTSAVLSDTTWTTERLRMRCQDVNNQPGMQRDSMMHHDSAGMQMNDSMPSSADSTRPPPKF